MASDTLFYCSFCDPTCNLSLDHYHNLARTSEGTFTNRNSSKEGTSKAFSPPPPLVALFKVSNKVYLTLEIVISKDMPVLCQLIYDHKDKCSTSLELL